MGTSGGIASEHPLASVAGLRTLSEEGNAVDATVATSLSLAVTQPHLGSLGGDFFALIYEASTGKVHCINASGWSPKKLTLEHLRNEGLSHVPVESPHAVVVPGLVDGLNTIHQKFGTAKFEKLAETAVHLAEKGFPVSHKLSAAIERGKPKLKEPCAKRFFFKAEKPLAPGEMLAQKSLAAVLKDLASDPRVFYEGWIAESLCRYINSKGGVIEPDDFKHFEAEWVDPLKITYRNLDVYEVPPNSQGATTLVILNILENFDIGSLGAFRAERVHLFVEAAKRAYMEKNQYLADPRFTEIPLDKILSKAHAQNLAESIEPESVFVDASLKPGDTTNFVVIDGSGNVVSAIQSIYHSFGSGLMDPETGILLNSRGSYFTQAGANKLEPRKRPLHTLSSVIALSDEDEIVALGASGGDYRPQQHVLLLTNIFDYGMSLQEAVEAPRFLWNGGRNIIVEEGFEELKHLQKIGHELSWKKYPGPTGVAHCGMKKGRTTMLSADVRGDGLPVGIAL